MASKKIDINSIPESFSKWEQYKDIDKTMMYLMKAISHMTWICVMNRAVRTQSGRKGAKSQDTDAFTHLIW